MAPRPSNRSGDLVLSFAGSDLATLLADAGRAFGEAVAGPQAAATDTEAIALEAADPEELVVAFLNELVGLLETRRFVAASARMQVREDVSWPCRFRASGSVLGFRMDAAFRPHVVPKAATYHDLEVRRGADQCSAAVTVDL